MVPDAAIGTEQVRKFVYVVGADDVAKQVYVTLGQVVDGLRVIKDGLAADDRVVVNGLMRVRPGLKVKPEEQGVAAAVASQARSRTERRPHAMRISHFFIDRPIFAAVVSIVFIILGGVSFLRLPVAQYPEIAPPIINVTGQYPGASAEVVAATVVSPIEDQINGVEGMLYVSSNSTADGRFSIAVTFDLGTNLDIAQVQVQNRVAIAQPRLPADVRNIGVTITKSSPDLMMVVHLYSPDKSRGDLFVSNYATLEIKDALTRVDGVGSITVFGSRDYAMRVWLDPDRLQSLGMTAQDVITALLGQNVQVASGVLGAPPVDKPQAFQISVQTQGRLVDPEEFGDITVKTTPNAVVRLKRRRADRARRPGLRLELLPQSRSGGGARHLPAAGLECAGDRQAHPPDHGPARAAVPDRDQVRHRLRSHAVHPAIRQRGGEDHRRSRACWSCWSSSCSCRPGAPRSFPSSPFRSR